MRRKKKIKANFLISVIVSFQFLLEIEAISNIPGRNVQYLLP